MAESSRKGRSISRKACDLCRERKIQCVFNGSSAVCQRCFKADVPCTFLTDRKPRGPPSKRVAEARQRAAAELTSASPPTSSSGPSPAPPGPLQLAIGSPSIAHFVPEHTLSIIIDDFFERVYPVLPLVHVPSFTRDFAARRYETDPAFLRLCIALCAATIASIPRRISVYGSPWYRDVVDMVDRAVHLMHLSRLTSEPAWSNRPTVETMVCSVIMALAAHYAGRVPVGWTFAAEAVSYFRVNDMYKKPSYAGLTPVETELCKRGFWVLFFMQMHDRISHFTPHLGMSYDPLFTDWDFLMPVELSDDDLVSEMAIDGASPTGRSLPMISGFIALVKVFLSVADLLHKAFPGAPAGYRLSSGAWETNLFNEYEHHRTQVSTTPMLDSLFQVMARLESTLSDLPEALSMPRRRGSPRTARSDAGQSLPQLSPQFDIMRANIHITAIYIQSTILETCLTKMAAPKTEPPQQIGSALTPGSQSSPADQPTPPDASAREQVWELREAIARELLDVVSCNSSWTLESNGMSMIIKIREIASTLLERNEGAGTLSEAERRSRDYISQFVEILADLDYAPRAHVGGQR
ncbi:hypothetical protein F5X68DRAFT_214552 [Plectosphaerella plurivora]|uniref:Zn(2)-C6 fungal-type domain-containing protein n=1 Tax=Plectosphaerella plurivora TaxID=936078 RepID=A0A9P8V5E7_9PEZI|nr:hypothetical protein F5X68DRAFT_214552 [Plectosphaerella plurivora]